MEITYLMAQNDTTSGHLVKSLYGAKIALKNAVRERTKKAVGVGRQIYGRNGATMTINQFCANKYIIPFFLI